MKDIFEEIILIDKDTTAKQQLAQDNLNNLQESLDQDISQLCSGILEEAKQKVQDYADSLESQKEQNKKLINEQTQSQCLLIKNAFLNVKDGLVEQLFNELKTERS
ncbi:MAG: hypothetical protein ATN31_10710 [Candidatus Epulonipiscioides saccharophilum]|nr:MAG: hypothetical protein ATN31_10710 [Epulopiscium sp. AS2M-Bin001]